MQEGAFRGTRPGAGCKAAEHGPDCVKLGEVLDVVNSLDGRKLKGWLPLSVTVERSWVRKEFFCAVAKSISHPTA